MKDKLLIKYPIIEKYKNVYDIYVLLDKEHFFARPLYKGIDIEKAKEAINRYCDHHIKNVELLRQGCLKKLEKLNEDNNYERLETRSDYL